MDISFKIDAKPFSVNKAYYRNRKRTVECRKWGDSILDQLDSFHVEFKSLHDFISSHINTHSLSVIIHYFIPKSKLLTKKGKISRLSSDLSNIEKLLIDLIFDPRFFERGYNNLNLDDCLISELRSSKKISKDDSYYIQVKIETRLNSDL